MITVKQYEAMLVKRRGLGNKIAARVARIWYAAVLGKEFPERMVVHHVDRDWRNNHPSNLAVLTWSQHARIHRSPPREDNSVTLTDELMKLVALEICL